MRICFEYGLHNNGRAPTAASKILGGKMADAAKPKTYPSYAKPSFYWRLVSTPTKIGVAGNFEMARYETDTCRASGPALGISTRNLDHSGSLDGRCMHMSPNI